MKLDLPTLLWTLTLASGVLAAAVLTVAWREKLHRGLSLWGLGLVVNALSYPAFGLRALGWPHTSIVLANLLTALTIVMHTLGLMEFQRSRARALPVWLVCLPAVLNVLVASLLLHDDHWRNVLVAALQSVLAGLFLSQAWAPELEGRRLTGRLVVIAGTGLLLVTFVVRTLFMIAVSDWDGHYNVPDHVQAWTYFATLAILLVNSMGFVLMQMEHAIVQQTTLATHDGLTGLYNRHALMEALERYGAQSQRGGTCLALLMIDIDHFKAVNDQHGHLAGDEVLREVAQRAQNRLRRADLLARYGGEEFLALLPLTDQAGATVVAQAIRRAMEEQPISVRGHGIAVTVSIGVHAAVVPAAAGATEAMVAASDQALYLAKHQGRNRVVVG